MDYSNEEMNPVIYTLIDEEENEHQFELVDTLEENDVTYYAMTPVLSDPEALESSDGELILLKGQLEGDEEILVTIDNEEEFNKIGEIFLKRINEIIEEEDL